MIVAALALAVFAGTTHFAAAYPITVDGASGEWFSRAPLADDTAIVARNASEHGEHIWLDRSGDARTTFANPDNRADIIRARVTGTTSDLNVLIQVTDLDQATGDGAPQLQLALDLDGTPGSGQTDFVAGAETEVANAVRWERLLQTRLGSGGGNVAVWSTSAGPPVFAGSVSASGGTSDVIELSVPWSALGLAGAPAAFNATTALFRSATDDTTKEAPESDALDVVSDYGDPGTAAGTDAEVGDGTVDYFTGVRLTPLGEPRGPLVVAAFGANIAAQPDAEWIEVANATASTLNISGYKLGDATTPGAPEAMFTFPAGTELVAGGRLRVARNGAAFQTKFGSLPDLEFENTSSAPDMSPFAPWSAGSLDLADSGDELVVLDGSNTTVDAVPYGSGSYTGVGTLAAPAADAVLQRNPSLRDTDEAADFSTAACAGTKTWDGGAATTSWQDANNWNPNGVPAAGDHVCIDNTAHASIVFNGTTTVLSVTSAETIDVIGGTLTLTSPTQQSSLAAFNFSGGTIGGAGSLVVNGPATWTNGQFAATATTVKTTFNGPLALGNGDHQLQVRQIELNGDTTWTGGRILMGGGAAITNTASHAFAIETDDDFQFWFGPGCAFNNAGTVTKVIDGSAANETTTVIDSGIVFNNTGSATAVTGTLEANGGGVSSGSFTAAAGGGVVFGGHSGITTTLTPASSIAGSGSVRFTGGTSNVNGTYANTGPATVSGGTINLGAPLNGNALTASGGTLVLTQPSTAASLTLAGATIQGSANLTVNGPSTWSSGGFAADSTSVKTTFNGALTMNGTEHQLQVRHLEINANATWTSARFLIGGGAAVTNGSGSTFAIQTDDDFQFWFGPGSSFTNAGTVTKEIDGNAANDTTTVVDSGISFNNAGTASVISGTLQTDGGGASTGSFSVAAGGGLVFGGHSGITTNLNAGSSLGGAGSLRFAAGTTNVNGTYTHTGALSITGGTAVFAPPLNANPLTAPGGTLVLNAASTVPSLTLSGATIQGSANLTVTGPTTWSNGGFAADSNAVKTIFNGPLTMNGTEHQLQVRQLEINANATWTSARFLIGGGATVTNGSGSTFAIQTDDDFQFWFGPASVFNNAGTLTKIVDANGGNGTVSTVDIAFNNTGTATVVDGTLDLSGGGASTGAFSVPVGSTLQFSGGTNNLNGGASLSAAGVVRLSGGTTNVVGTYDATNLTEVTNGTANFNVTGPLDALPAHTARLVQTGGTLGGNDVFEIADRFTWHGGTQTDNGETRIVSGATLELTGGSSRTLSGKRTLFNQGLITWTVPGSWHVGGGTPSGATIRNAGTFEFRDGQSITSGGGEVQFLNVPGGLVTKIGAPGGQTTNWSGEEGAADANGNAVGSIPGWTRVDNFTVVPYGAAGFPAVSDAPSGAGANFFAGGPTNAQSRISQTLDVSGSAAAVDVGEFTAVLEGELGGSGAEEDAMTVHAVFLSGGTELGRATIGPVLAADRGNVTGFEFRSTSAVVPAGTRTIRLEAIANRAAVGSSYNNAYADKIRLRVRDLEGFAGGSAIDIPFDNDAAAAGVDASHGTLSLAGGDVNESVGQFDVADGAVLQFSGGTHDLGSGSSVDGPGTFRVTTGVVNSQSVPFDVRMLTVAGGTANLNTASAADVLRQSGGAIGGSGVLTLNGPGPSSWTSGEMLGTGTTAVPAGVTLNLSGTGTKTLRRVLDNAGTVTWSGTGEIHSGNATVFSNSGLFDIRNNQTYHHNHGGLSQLNNTGTIRKSVGTGLTDIDPPVDNDGTVDVQTGTLSFDGGDGPNASSGAFDVPATLQFAGGLYDLGASSDISGSGTVRFQGGTANVGGAYDVGSTEITSGTGNFDAAGSLTDVFTQSGGILGGSGVLTLTGPGASSWTSGQMLGSGTTAVPAGVTLNLSGTGTKTLRRVLDNAGTVTWSGTGEIHSGNATVFSNSGLFDIQNNQVYHHNHGGVSQLNNTGVLRKSAGTGGTTRIDVPFDSTGGTVEADVGTLHVNGPFANYNAATDVLTGGTYVVQDTLRFNNADVVTNDAKVVLDGAASRVLDNGVPGLDGFRRLSTNGANGDFSIVNGRNLFTAAARGPDLTNNGVLRGTGTYFQNVTNNGTVAPGASPGILTVNGTYTQSAAGTLEIEVGGTATAGTDYDRLVVTGTADLDGTLAGKLLGPFTPVTGVGIDVVTAAPRSDTFALVTPSPSPLPGNLVFEARYDPTTVKLFAVPGGGAADDSVAEAAGTKTITVTLSAASSEQVTVDYATANGTAEAGTDYQAASGTLTFAPGDTSETFDVTILDDGRDEPDQTFLVNLTSASNTVLTDTQATITITDNDAEPSIAIADATKAEGSAGMTAFDFAISLSAASERTVTVDYVTSDGTATEGVDYALVGGTVTFAPGDTSEQVTVQVTGDTNVEFDENFFVDLAGPVNATIADAQGRGSIVDDDQGGAASQLSINDASVAETDGVGAQATFTVTLSPAPTTPVSVQFATLDGSAAAGSDYTSTSGTLMFATTDATKTITVPVTGENRDETTETFTVVLSSPVGAALSDAVGLATITDDDVAPSASDLPELVTDEDDDLVIELGVTTDGDGDAVTYDIVAGPTNGSVTTPTGNTATYSPAADYNGGDSFTFRASDGVNSTTAEATITVGPVNDSPTALDDVASVSEDGFIDITPLTNDSDVDGNDLHIDSVADPVNGQATITGEGSTGIEYRPDANYTGFDTFDYTIEDTAGLQATGSITVFVAAVNDAPVANEAAETTAEDTAKTIALASSDVEGSSRTYSIVSGPAHGSLSTITGDQLTYTPSANYNGPDSFRFKANDGTLDSAAATVTINVTPVNDAPAAASVSITTAEDTPTGVTFAGADIDGDVLTYSVTTPPAKGSVSPGTGAGRTYTPSLNANGNDSFVYSVSDGTASATATVSVTINAVNDAPVAAADTFTVAEDTDFSLVDVLANDSDVDAGDTLTVTAVSDPPNGTARLGSVEYKPDANHSGSDSFTYTLSDGNGGIVTGQVNVTVTGVNDAPIAEGLDVVTVQDRAVTVTLRATDVDADALTFNLATDPANGTAGIVGNKATYTPNGGFTGSDSFTFTATDGTATSAAGTVNVEIVAAGGATTASIADVAISETDDEAVFTLALSSAANGSRIHVETDDDTAKAGFDYFGAGTTFTFSGGQTSHEFAVKLADDALDEDGERFRVNITVEEGGVVAPDTVAFGTIADDDPLPGVSAGAVDVSEGNGGSKVVSVPVSLSAPSGRQVSVDYATGGGDATAGADYAPSAGTLTFAAGETAKSISVVVAGDDAVELDESLQVTLTSPVNASVLGGGTVRILNDDSLVPLPPPPPPAPAAPTADLALTISGPASSAVDRAVTFAIGVRNNGPDAATGVVVTDALPSGLQLVSATVGAVACAGTQVVSCPVGSLANGATAAVTVVATTTEPGVHTNSAAVSGQQPDPAAGNNSATATTRVPLPVVREPAQTGGCTQRGTNGPDVLRGGPGVDVLCGAGGNDVLIGFGGNDKLIGGAGNDRILGGAGNDNLKGGNGRDNLLGGAGDDRLDGGYGRDNLAGEAGADKLFGSFGDDFLNGGKGKDRNLGGPGADRLRRDRQDTSLGGPGRDRCIRSGVVSVC